MLDDGRQTIEATTIETVETKRPSDPLSTTEAAFALGWDMAIGLAYTTREAAAVIGLQPNGAYKLLCRASRARPIAEFQRMHHGRLQLVWCQIPVNPDS